MLSNPQVGAGAMGRSTRAVSQNDKLYGVGSIASSGGLREHFCFAPMTGPAYRRGVRGCHGFAVQSEKFAVPQKIFAVSMLREFISKPLELLVKLIPESGKLA
jgi:hypothetical protein